MARRAPAADSNEGHFTSGRSGIRNNDDSSLDEFPSSDGYLEAFDLISGLVGQDHSLGGNVSSNNNARTDEDDDDDDDDSYVYNSNDGPSDDISEVSGEYHAGEESRPTLASPSPYPPYYTSNIRLSSHDDLFTNILGLQPSDASRLPLGVSLAHEDSAINVEDGEDAESDDLEYLGQIDFDFSSPSFLSDSPRTHAADAMPQTRRQSVSRTAAAASAFPFPMPDDPAAASSPSAATSGPQTRSNSNSRAGASHTSPSASRSHKRRRSGESGPSGTTLPPIADILASVGSSSGGSSRAQNDSQASSSGGSSSRANNSQPGRSQVSPKRPRREQTIILDDDLFPSDDEANMGVQVVSLVDVDRPQAASQNDDDDETAAKDEPAEPEPKRAEPKRAKTIVRLSALQCVICMDDMTDLTVTHCGHIFCGECLHSSLSIVASRRICPICRTKVEMRAPGISQTRIARSYFPLQLKMRARPQTGKQLDPSN